MSVTQAMEWLIEYVDDPSADAPLPGQDSSAVAGAAAATTPGPSASASASASNVSHNVSRQSSADESSRQDEFTEIFKRIRRKREFRPDSRVDGFILHFSLLKRILKPVTLVAAFSTMFETAMGLETLPEMRLPYTEAFVFTPDSLFLQAVVALIEMGFDEKKVIDALRVNNNQQDAAVGV